VVAPWWCALSIVDTAPLPPFPFAPRRSTLGRACDRRLAGTTHQSCDRETGGHAHRYRNRFRLAPQHALPGLTCTGCGRWPMLLNRAFTTFLTPDAELTVKEGKGTCLHMAGLGANAPLGADTTVSASTTSDALDITLSSTATRATSVHMHPPHAAGSARSTQVLHLEPTDSAFALAVLSGAGAKLTLDNQPAEFALRFHLARGRGALVDGTPARVPPHTLSRASLWLHAGGEQSLALDDAAVPRPLRRPLRLAFANTDEDGDRARLSLASRDPSSNLLHVDDDDPQCVHRRALPHRGRRRRSEPRVSRRRSDERRRTGHVAHPHAASDCCGCAAASTNAEPAAGPLPRGAAAPEGDLHPTPKMVGPWGAVAARLVLHPFRGS
jgi:hypothetical protein